MRYERAFQIYIYTIRNQFNTAQDLLLSITHKYILLLTFRNFHEYHHMPNPTEYWQLSILTMGLEKSTIFIVNYTVN